MPKCVRCGYCCTEGHCPLLETDPETGECRHLKVSVKTESFNIYRCDLYGEGQASPEVAAALKIGAGCEVEFNEDRRQIACSSGPPIDWAAV